LHWIAGGVRASMLQSNDSVLSAIDPELARHVDALRRLSRQAPGDDAHDWFEAASIVAENSLGHLPARDLEGLWIGPSWIDAQAQPESVRKVLAAYSAAARRDAGEMFRAGQDALQALDPQAPTLVRQQMLMIALLGAHVSEGHEAAGEIERVQGPRVSANGSYGLARAFLLAWADDEDRR
jgi:hypothetical protein